jgi:hypothetical protein
MNEAEENKVRKYERDRKRAQRAKKCIKDYSIDIAVVRR